MHRGQPDIVQYYLLGAGQGAHQPQRSRTAQPIHHPRCLSLQHELLYDPHLGGALPGELDMNLRLALVDDKLAKEALADVSPQIGSG
ncbi:MAG: hypothetical protein A4E43_01606 [Methanosaeta sp. PtaB.Bin005]|nr:MAG: hypothetical protein A4E43_01606 [Methanosaeta sp. PtaB.Bin005]